MMFKKDYWDFGSLIIWNKLISKINEET